MELAAIMELVKLAAPYVVAVISGVFATYKASKAKNFAKAAEALRESLAKQRMALEASIAGIELLPEGEHKKQAKRFVEVALQVGASADMMNDAVQSIVTALKAQGLFAAGGDEAMARRFGEFLEREGGK